MGEPKPPFVTNQGGKKPSAAELLSDLYKEIDNRRGKEDSEKRIKDRVEQAQAPQRKIVETQARSAILAGDFMDFAGLAEKFRILGIDAGKILEDNTDDLDIVGRRLLLDSRGFGKRKEKREFEEFVRGWKELGWKPEHPDLQEAIINIK